MFVNGMSGTLIGRLQIRFCLISVTMAYIEFFCQKLIDHIITNFNLGILYSETVIVTQIQH